MRRSPRIVGAVGISIATSVVGITALSGSAGASSNAQTEYQAALRTAGSQGVHYVSKASEQGVTIDVIGDTGKTSGSQVLTVRKGSLTERVEVILVGSTGYLQGNAIALQNILGLTAAQSTTYANKWLSFPTANATLAQLVSGLRNKDVATELKMSGPYTSGGNKMIGNQTTQAIKGFVSTSTGSKVPVVLYVQSGSTPRPVEEVTNPGKATTSIQGTVIFSNWGEKIHPTAPAHSVSLISLAPAG